MGHVLLFPDTQPHVNTRNRPAEIPPGCGLKRDGDCVMIEDGNNPKWELGSMGPLYSAENHCTDIVQTEDSSESVVW